MTRLECDAADIFQGHEIHLSNIIQMNPDEAMRRTCKYFATLLMISIMVLVSGS